MADIVGVFSFGTFSVKYTGKNYVSCAVDWDWEYKREWARSEHEGNVHWFSQQGLDVQAHIILLDYFGLLFWKEEFSMEKVLTMSPAELVEARHSKEDSLDLVRRIVKNMTLGFSNILAENYV